MKLILASKSPRRKQILEELGVKFEIIPAVGDEVVDNSLSPEEIVESIALAKAKEIFSKNPDCAVIGADTIVVLNGEILQKPRDRQDAENMLKSLSGKSHQVFTGYALLTSERCISGAEQSIVVFNELSQSTIDDYVKSGLCMDKAGSYGVQDGYNLVKEVKGSYYNVVGFPKELFSVLLQDFDFEK